MSIKQRLQMLNGMVIPGRGAADIGADHGQLAVALLEQGVVPFVIATDVNGGPGQRLRTCMAEKDINHLEVRLGDGLKVLRRGEVGTVIMAGLGGDTIVDIVRADLKKTASFTRFVFQPMSKEAVLRAFCAEHGLQIISEQVCAVFGRFYVMMAYEPGGEPYPLTVAEKEIGPVLIRQTDAVSIRYKMNKLQKYRRIVAGLERSQEPERNDKQAYYQDLITEMEKRCLNR